MTAEQLRYIEMYLDDECPVEFMKLALKETNYDKWGKPLYHK